MGSQIHKWQASEDGAATSEQIDEQSGVRPALARQRALRLVMRWSALYQSRSSHAEDVHQLEREISSDLEQCRERLVAAPASGDEPDVGELLEASYVLERLEWCVLHNAPYIERPRSALFD